MEIRNKIRLVATDMDGTLLNSKKELPPDFIPWVKEHPDIRTVIASGRPYFTLREQFAEIADRLLFICDNGSFVFDGDRMLSCNAMTSEDIARTMQLTRNIPDICFILCGSRAGYVTPTQNAAIREETDRYYHLVETLPTPEAWDGRDEIGKIALCIHPSDIPAALAALEGLDPRVSPVHSGTMWIDVSNRTVSKGTAMRSIQQLLSIPPEACMAFGDFPNDLTLLQACGESYCMANGHPDVKAAAKYIAAANDDDGVMKILRTL